MDINPRKGLKGLLTRRNKGGSSKEIPKSQVSANLPPPPSLPVTTVEPLPRPDLKKKRKVQEVEEGEVVPSKGSKQPQNARDKWASSVDSREDPIETEVHQ